MLRSRVFLLLSFCLGWISWSNAQAGDSTTISYDLYLDQVLTHHPIAKQGQLRPEMVQAKWRSARGNFDPKLGADWSHKFYDEKLYYQKYGGKLEIPTVLGVGVVAGYKNARGVFLNPENKISDVGLWNIGVEVDLLQGLIINERKIALEQAKIFQDLALNEQQLMFNDLILNASFAYANWQQYQEEKRILLENESLAETYYQNTSLSYKNGEKTAMDTLEAFILYQEAVNQVAKNNISLSKAKQVVENFLWFDKNPVTLKPSVFPEALKDPEFLVGGLVPSDTMRANIHPLVLESENKRLQLAQKQRLNREKLKPKLNVHYNALLSTREDEWAPVYSSEDYRWGFNFSFPLFLRSERAEIQRTDLFMQEVLLDIENKRNQIENGIDGSLERIEVLQALIERERNNIEGYRLLLEGETLKFNYGESSVFLINKRQEKYINGKLKLIELQTKLQVEIFNYWYYTNQWGEESMN